jgi:hypothetical protein
VALRRFASVAVLAVAFLVGSAQTPAVSPSPSPSPATAPSASGSPIVSPMPQAMPTAPAVTEPGTEPSASGLPPVPTPTPTLPPITVSPSLAAVPIGNPVAVTVGSAIAPLTAVAHDPAIVDVAIDQNAQTVTLSGKVPGSTVVTVTDARGLTRDVPVRVAYYAGTVGERTTLEVTGNPTSADYVRQEAVGAVVRAAQLRPGAQIIVNGDDVPFNGTLAQDGVTSFTVPVLLQGNNYFEVNGSTRVDVRNIAAPRISPESLMVSDYPERLEENGMLFQTQLKSEQPSRFLYFHYNPPGQPDRRIVLRASNPSNQPALVQFISGRGGPTPNEMDAGHRATKAFLVDVAQNQGRLIEIPANTSINISQQDIPAGSIVCNLLQLRVLSGADVALSLFAQSIGDDPNVPPATADLLQATHKHARGIYPIPEFYYATQWNVNDDYLELPIGQIPLPNDLQGEALAGDYGVLQSFVVTVQNPLSTPETIAIYENPRGGRATETYLIDGVMVQSHQVPPFSRYKVRQYLIPARGFVRVNIVTMPEAGSSYPLRLVFAPDDGSVMPGGPGSPIY